MVVLLKAKNLHLMEHNKVHNIKQLRYATGLGLREAKQLLERVMAGGDQQTVQLKNEFCDHHQDPILTLESFFMGVLVKSAADIKGFEEMYGSTLRALASQAILAGHDDLANDLMKTIKFYDADA